MPSHDKRSPWWVFFGTKEDLMRCCIRCFLSTLVLCALSAAVQAQNAPVPGKAALKKTPQPVTSKPEGLLRIYPTPDGQAEGLAKLLQEVYKESAHVRIAALGNHQIAVWAGPDVHMEIARQQPLAPAITEVVHVADQDAEKLAETIRTTFRDLKPGALFIEALPQRNALLLRGSAEQVREAQEVIRRVAGDLPSAGNLRIITLDQANATVMAEAVRDLLSQLRSNPVRVIVPAKTPGIPPAKAEPAPKGAKPGKADAPVTLTAFGNRLIVTTDDPQAMALVVELTRMLQAPSGEGDFAVIRLKYAQAANLAQTLDDVFNGSRPGRVGTGGAPMAPGASAARMDRVRIVAEPITNTLLIKASPLDVLTIRNLLAKSLDIPEAANMRESVPDGKKKKKKAGAD
jgi:type II secretory pathway component GspD/PulD (secretin)